MKTGELDKKITAEELDKKFDDGEEDILEYFDLSKARRPGLEPKRVNVDHSCIREAGRVHCGRGSHGDDLDAGLGQRVNQADDEDG